MDDAGSTPVAIPVAVDLSRFALIIARLFASTELAHDAATFTRLGDGRVRLDLLRRQSRHGERWIPFPHIGGILRNRMTAELQAFAIPFDQLAVAELDAEIRYTTVPEPPLPGPGQGGWAVPGPLIAATMKLTVRVATTGGQWQAQHDSQVTWPESWGRK